MAETSEIDRLPLDQITRRARCLTGALRLVLRVEPFENEPVKTLRKCFSEFFGQFTLP